LNDVELEIARRIRERQPYNVIARDLKVSAKTIAKVSAALKNGRIKFDEDGNPIFVDKSQLETREETAAVMPLVYKIMRGLGVETPQEALEQAYRFIVKVNPYMLYYGIKSPVDLVKHLEARIEKLRKELDAYRNEDAFSLARRLGVTDRAIRFYKRFLADYGDEWNGTLADFLNDSVEYMAIKAGYTTRRPKKTVEEYVL